MEKIIGEPAEGQAQDFLQPPDKQEYRLSRDPNRKTEYEDFLSEDEKENSSKEDDEDNEDNELSHDKKKQFYNEYVKRTQSRLQQDMQEFMHFKQQQQQSDSKNPQLTQNQQQEQAKPGDQAGNSSQQSKEGPLAQLNPPTALQQNMTASLSQFYNIDDIDPSIRQYMIINRDTGEIIDGRNDEIVAKLVENTEQMKKKIGVKAWNDFWKHVRSQNEQLITACTLGDVEKVKRLLDPLQNMYPVDINIQGLDNWTPLHFAVASDNSEIVALLLQNQADIEALSSFNRTPIHIAALKGSFDSMKLLIEHKVNLNSQDRELYTALHFAAEYDHYQIVELLLKSGAKADILNQKQIYAYQATKNFEIQELFRKYNSVYENRHSYTSNQLFGKEIGMSKVQFVEKMLSQQSWQQQVPQKQASNEQKHKEYDRDSKKIQKWNQIKPISFQVVLDQVGPNSFQYWKLLGKGAFGEVYLVTKDNNPNVRYAMKILRKERIMKQKLQRYANTEKEVLNVMNHPFITRLYYAFQTADKLFLVLEYCPGGDLGTVLSKQKKISEELARIYIAEILLALEALHSKYIVYRDLKPENVLIGEDGHLKLTDFGLAKKNVLDDDVCKSFLGTPAYFAPEIVTKQGHTRQVDWYNLGVLLYELLVGTPPYYARDREQLFENIKKAPLKIPKSMSVEAKELIKQLLNRNYKKRLGAQKDGEELREQEFFKSVDWNQLYNKKYPMLKPKQEELPKKPLKLEFQLQLDPKDKFENWSIYNPDIICQPQQQSKPN